MNKEKVYKSVVQVICCEDEETPLKDCDVGTGFFISKNLIITATHVVQMHYTEKCNVYIIPINLGIDRRIKAKPLLKVDELDLPVMLLEVDEEIEVDTLKFTQDYRIKDSDSWFSFGYPAIKWNKGHPQQGSVLRKLNTQNSEKVDIDLGLGIDRINNYKGFSGAPLIINEMLVGVIQEQAISNQEAQSIGAISIELFKKFISEDYCIDNKHKMVFKNTFRDYTISCIDKNIRNKKYIPDIYVEVGNLKENARYFTDPMLFWEKILEDIERYKLVSINTLLEKFGLKPIENTIPDNIKKDIKFDDIRVRANEVIEMLNTTLKQLEGLKKEELEKRIKEEYRYAFEENYFKLDMPRIRYVIEDFIALLNIFSYDHILITEKAGQGKTNFLCDLTSNVLLKKDIDCLYFNANEFTNWDICTYIEKKIFSKLGYDFDSAMGQIKDICEQENKPFIIVMDGLNENANIQKFRNDLEIFLEKLKSYSFTKVIMTCRSEYLKERFGNLLKSSFSNRLLHVNSFTNQHDGIFAERLFRGYLDFFNIEISFIADEVYEKLTSDLLLLRIFCEAYGDIDASNKIILPPTYDIYKFDVFEKYLSYKLEEIDNKMGNNPGVSYSVIYRNLVNKIIDNMIEKGMFRNIPKDIIDQTSEIELLTRLIDEDIIFREDAIVKKGLIENNEPVISFTFDEFRDYCISKRLMESFGQIDKEEYMQIISSLTSKASEVAEGVSKYLFFASKKYSVKDFDAIIQAQKWYMHVYSTNIFSVNDDYITADDVELINRNFRDTVGKAARITSELLKRYDEDTFKKLGIGTLIDWILSLDEKQYKKLIEPIFEPVYEEKYRYSMYSRNKEHITIPINEYVEELTNKLESCDENSKEHAIFRFIILISDIDYSCIDFYDNYFTKFPNKALEAIDLMLKYNNKRVNKNIESILRSISYIEAKYDEDVASKFKELLAMLKVEEELETTIALKEFLESLHEFDEFEE